MSKAFLSHSSTQKPLIESIYRRLGKDNCVIDKYNFEPGTPTLNSIIEGIEKTDLFVIFLSDDALNSEWVKYEIEYAKNLKNLELSNRILIFLVDLTIYHDDKRIPDWLQKKYNLKHITDPILLYKKIDSKLRDISIENHPYVKKKEEIFIGRNLLMEEFEQKYYNLENIKPTAIIASGFEEVGRRKFVRHALDKVEKLNKYHNPISILLDSRDSIEDFILRIEDLNSIHPDETLKKIKNLELSEKVTFAIDLVSSFQENNEILFIIDKGCIVQPNKNIADWFLEIALDERFCNNTVLCLISTFRPNTSVIRNFLSLISFHVNELTPIDRQILFLKYCELFELQPDKAETEKILSVLNGMPGQVFHCVRMINDEGLINTINKLEEIKKHNDIKVFQIITAIKDEGLLFYNLLVFIARFEFVSYDFLYKIFSRNNSVEEALDKLYIYGVFDRIGVNKEYIQPHHAISEYVKRAKFQIDSETRLKLKELINLLLNDSNEYPDISQILITIKTLIQENQSIPERYFIPSFVLRTIIDHYYESKYNQVNILAQKMLANHLKYDPAIIREIRYWYCMSISRKPFEKSEDIFYENLREFEKGDYYFLLGFHKRIQKKFPEAEEHFRDALNFDGNSQKTKRELVNVLLSQNRYPEALEFAKANYLKNKLSAFHIQGYFMCLVRKRILFEEDKLILNELMGNIQISHDFKAKELYHTMKGEYEYFVNKNLANSIRILKEAINISVFKHYPRKALLEIYAKSNFKVEEAKLRREVDNQSDKFLYED